MDTQETFQVINGKPMSSKEIINRVIDRLGGNDGIYEFLMEDFNKLMNYKLIDPLPGKGKIGLIKYLRCETPFYKYGLKHTKDCTEGDMILEGYFDCAQRDKFRAELETFGLTRDNYSFTKKE